ncbi:WDR70 [Cordylochernes scorpioides]|uniref:WDR70 n=1 Tax=Cordylochernes scorpioides TaxID=51811 RepID=A0ABY6K7W1_9ARAC|nr:WDR70 [Cordylochernes scorpioides]
MSVAAKLQIETPDPEKQKKTPPTKDVVEGSRMIGPPIPSNIGKTPSTNQQPESEDDDNDSDEEDDFIGPPIPTNLSKPSATAADDEEEDKDEETTAEQYGTVCAHWLIPPSFPIFLTNIYDVLQVSALALDPNGARLVSGGFDFDVMFWDFAGMDSSLRAFRDFRPCECHQIRNLEYSHTGDCVLVVSGNSQAKVLNRDGLEVTECVKGDQYINDMSRTKGHVAMLNDGCWHPKDRDEFLTCSNDGTARLWKMHRSEAKQQHVIKPRRANGLRAIPTACSYSRDGNLVATACNDGSIQMWDHRRAFVNTSIMVRNAHQNDTETSCLNFSYSNQYFSTRGECPHITCVLGDDTLKLWDLRNVKQPVNTADNLFNLYPVTDCCFSPDDQLLVTGTSLRKGESVGKLLFFDRETFDVVESVEFQGAGVVRSLWHPKLNQILVGTSRGVIKVFYSPEISDRGAKLCVVKTRRKTKDVETLAEQQIITPHALPLFKQDRPRSRRKQMEKDRMDPVKSHRPDLPVTGPGGVQFCCFVSELFCLFLVHIVQTIMISIVSFLEKKKDHSQGGRLASAGNTLSSYIVRNLGLKKRVDDNMDPREAILKYAKDAEENPYWVTPAYSK